MSSQTIAIIGSSTLFAETESLDNIESIQTVDSSLLEPELRKPCYGSYCFAGIPGTILSLFGAHSSGQDLLPEKALETLPSSPRAVALLFVDAFGWHALSRYCNEVPVASLQKLREQSTCSKITSQFPSTTAAHVTTIHSGLPVAQTGVYEWHYYASQVDLLVAPLPFYSPIDEEGTFLGDRGIEASQFLPESVLYPALQKAGIERHIFQDERFSTSPYNARVMAPVTSRGFSDYRNGLDDLASHLVSSKERSYSFLYYDGFDHACHMAGPASQQADKVAKQFLSELETRLIKPLEDAGKGDIALLITADHGQIGIDPEKAIFIDEGLGFSEYLKCTQKGEPIVPAGSSRDFFLHIKDGKVDEAKDKLEDFLGDRASVYNTQDLVAAGVFGGTSLDGLPLEPNMAELVVLPKPGESVYWAGENRRYAKKFLGHHGGLYSEEMDSIFLALNC